MRSARAWKPKFLFVGTPFTARLQRTPGSRRDQVPSIDLPVPRVRKSEIRNPKSEISGAETETGTEW